MGLKGDLSTIALTEVFQLITSSGKEGTLVVYDDKSRKEIYFGRNGIRLLSTGERKGMALGELLVKKKIITPTQLSHALTTQKTTNLKLGEIICHLGFLKQDDLNKIIQNQIEEEIYDIFRWTEAKFEFIEGPPPTEPLISEKNPVSILTFDVNLLIKKVNQRNRDWEDVKDFFNNPKSIFKLTGDYEDKISSIQFSQNEKYVLPLISGFKTLQDILEESPINTFDTYKALHSLCQSKIVQEITPNEIKDYAKQLRKDKKLEQALFFYREAVKLNPQDLVSLENVAEMLEKLERPTEAGEEYKKLGKLLVGKNNIKLAIVSYKKAISFLPLDEEIYTSLFNSFIIQGQVDEAVKTGKELIKLYARSKKTNEILSLIEKLSSLKKPDVELRAYLVSAYFRMEEYNKSREEVNKIIKELPSQNIKTLIKAYEQILQVEPRQSDARYQLDSLRQIKIQQRKKINKLLLIVSLFLLVLAVVALFAWNDYSTYKRFLSLKDEVDGFKTKGEYETALGKYQTFKHPFTIYTKSLVQKENAALLALLHNKEERINSTINAELSSLKEIYNNALKVREKQNDYDGALKTLIDIKSQTKQALNDLPQKVYSMGGEQTIIESQSKNYQQLSEKIQQEISSIENYLKAAGILYNKAQEFDRADKLEEAASIIRHLSNTYGGSNLAKTSKIPVRIESIPPQAEVGINNVKQGKTPLKIYLPVKEPVTVTLTKRGFSKYTKEIKSYEQSSLFVVVLEKSAKWLFNNGTPLETTPLVADDVVFITTKDGYLKAVNSWDGSLRWVFRTDTPSEIYSSPKINNNLILFGANDNHLYAVRSNAAIKSYQVKTASPIRASPFFSPDGQITFIGSTDKNLYAISETGAILWKYNANAKISTTGVADKQTVYITSEDGVLHAINLKNGDKLWTLSLDGKPTSPIVSPVRAATKEPNKPQQTKTVNEADENMLYVGSTNNTIYAINLISQKIQWFYKLRGEVVAPLTLVDNALLVPCKDGVLYSIDTTTQKLNWQFNTKGPLTGGVSVSKKDRAIYMGSEDTYLYAVNLTNGQELWKYKTRNKIRSTPTTDDNTIYIGSDDSYLHAVEK